MTRSAVPMAGIATDITRVTPSFTTRNATGSTFTPAAVPPAKFFPSAALPKSLPPQLKPKLSRETGTKVTPSGVVMGWPMTVSLLTISRTLLMEVSIISLRLVFLFSILFILSWQALRILRRALRLLSQL